MVSGALGKSRRDIGILIASTALALAIAGHATTAVAATLRNVPPTPHGAPSNADLRSIGDAIAFAADELDWVVVGRREGSIQLSIFVRQRHEAVVEVGYDDRNYWIDYVSSKNLDYNPKDLVHRYGRRERIVKGPRIHKNYNRWIQNLAERIELRVASPPPELVVSPQKSLSPLLIADELAKLDGLRQRGILTDEEFEQQKAKLLER